MITTIFLWICIGILIGSAGYIFVKKSHDIEEDMVSSILGSFFGGYFLTFLSPGHAIGFSFSTVIAGVVGAICVLCSSKLFFHARAL